MPFAKLFSLARELENGSARLSGSRILYVGNKLRYSNRLAVTFFIFFWWLFHCYVKWQNLWATDQPHDRIRQLVHASLKSLLTSLAGSFHPEHTWTFLVSGEYFEYVRCCFGWDSFVFDLRSRFVLFKQWLSNIRAIPFSRPNFPKSTYFFLCIFKLALFSLPENGLCCT